MALLAAIVLVALVALDWWRDRPLDPRPVLSHPRWLWLLVVAGAAASVALPPLFFLASCCALGALSALLLQRFRLTADGIEAPGALLAWHTIREVRRSFFCVEVRTALGQRLRLPWWMDGLATLRDTLGEWPISRRPAASSS